MPVRSRGREIASPCLTLDLQQGQGEGRGPEMVGTSSPNSPCLGCFLSFLNNAGPAMLVIILGPSGVGKSAAIKTLCEKNSWRPIISYVTRPEREDDLYKISISSRSFQMLSELDKLWSDVEQGGYRYGLLRSEIELAVASSEVWIVDFALSSWSKYFSAVDHLLISMQAESDEALRQRLIDSSRSSRIDSSIASNAELNDWIARGEQGVTLHQVINRTGSLSDAVAAIELAVARKV